MRITKELKVLKSRVFSRVPQRSDPLLLLAPSSPPRFFPGRTRGRQVAKDEGTEDEEVEWRREVKGQRNAAGQKGGSEG